MYRDFFEPPPRIAGGRHGTKPKNSSSKATGQVRFHEEVRVKKIRAKGKNLPLSTMDDDDDEEEEEDSRLQTAVHQQEWLSNASSEDSIILDDDENAESHQDDDDPRRDTIERLKDDLFAEEEDIPHQGEPLVMGRRLCNSSYRSYNLQISQHTKRECRSSVNKLQR